MLFTFPMKPTFSAPCFFFFLSFPLPSVCIFHLYKHDLSTDPRTLTQQVCGSKACSPGSVACSLSALIGLAAVNNMDMCMGTHTWLLYFSCIACIIVQRSFIADSTTIISQGAKFGPQMSHFLILGCTGLYAPAL